MTLIIDTTVARAEWVARVCKQAEQMLIIATATNDDDMREELFEYAVLLEDHAERIARAT